MYLNVSPFLKITCNYAPSFGSPSPEENKASLFLIPRMQVDCFFFLLLASCPKNKPFAPADHGKGRRSYHSPSLQQKKSCRSKTPLTATFNYIAVLALARNDTTNLQTVREAKRGAVRKRQGEDEEEEADEQRRRNNTRLKTVIRFKTTSISFLAASS